MYQADTHGTGFGASVVPWSLSPRDSITLGPADYPRVDQGLAGCCSDCAGGMGALDLSTIGWGGYAALGLGLWLASRVLFTGGRAKERRTAMRAVDADYRLKRDEIRAKYPRL